MSNNRFNADSKNTNSKQIAENKPSSTTAMTTSLQRPSSVNINVDDKTPKKTITASPLVESNGKRKIDSSNDPLAKKIHANTTNRTISVVSTSEEDGKNSFMAGRFKKSFEAGFIRKPTVQNGKSEIKNVTSEVETDPYVSQFVGRFNANYARMYSEIIKGLASSKAAPDYSKLGNIGNKEYLFAESREDKEKAINFLNAFWKVHADSVIELHQQKYSGTESTKPMYPSCISFINATVGQEKYCFIAISSLDKNQNSKAILALRNFINQYKEGDIKFAFIESSKYSTNTNFSLLISGIAKHYDENTTYKPCAEKYYGACVTKLYEEYGDDIRIESVINGDFYPYKDKTIYGHHENTSDRTVVPPMNKDYKVTEDNFLIQCKPCCTACQKNIIPTLIIFSYAREFGIERKQRAKVAIALTTDSTPPSPPRTSPLKSSLSNKICRLINDSVNKNKISAETKTQEPPKSPKLKIGG